MKPSKKNPIRISVVESDPLRFLGLHAIFASEADMQVRAVTLSTILHNPNEDVVLITSSKGPTLHAAMGALKAVRPGLPVIVTGPGNRQDDILRAISCGAKGYIPEEATAAELKRAIREVYAGSVWAPGNVLATFIDLATTSARKFHSEPEERISERELEVLRLLVSGCSNKEIADQLGIEERTVKAHVAQLLRKVGVQNRIALSVHAVTHALLTARP